MRSAQTVFVRSCLLLLFLFATGGRAIAQLQMGPEFRVNNGTAGHQMDPRVAVDAAGNFLVVWGGDAVAAQRFDVRGRRRGGELVIDNEFSSPVDVAMNGAGEFVAAWIGTFSRLTVGRFAATGVPVFAPVERLGYGYTGAAVGTAADGSFVVAWSNNSFYYGNYHSIERFDRRGRSLGTINQGGGDRPALAMNEGGDFILVWEAERRIFGQRFDAAGGTIGSTIQISGSQTGTAAGPAISLAHDGSFVVTWEAFRQNGAQRDVLARRFGAHGAPIGDAFQVNTGAGSEFSPDPDVAVAPDQSFVIVWESRGQDGDEGGVFGRRFAASGEPAGAEFQINSFTTFDQSVPTVAFDANGAGIVAWSSYEQDGSGLGIYARRIVSPAGAADGDGDGIANAVDNCPTIPNASQADAGFDLLGDACVPPDVLIHPTAQIGLDPIIGHGSVLAAGVAIGDGARFGEEVRLERQARAGHKVELGDRVTVGIRAALGSNVSVGPDTHIEAGASIGEGATIGDGATIGRNAAVGPRATIGPLVLLDMGARIGRAATVEMGARVGRRAVVRPGAVVPAGTTVAAGTTFPP